MNLQFLSREVTDKLAREVSQNIDVYRSGKTEGLIRAGDCLTSRIECVKSPTLDDLAEDKLDAVASQRIFQWLSDLTPVQAADERLWVLLTHSYFANYLQKRWGSGLERSKQPEDLVLDRWFFRGTGVATFVRNGISRLWWFGYLTYDDKRANPFELTDVLLSLQDIQVAFLERSFGRCKPLLIAVLETVKKHQETLHNTPNSGNIIKDWAKEIRLYGGAYMLDAVPLARLTFVLDRMLRSKIAVT